jgi:hypothetical protein
MSSNAIESKNVDFSKYADPDSLLEAFPLGFDTQGNNHQMLNRNGIITKSLEPSMAKFNATQTKH